MKIKRILSVLIALVMVVGLVPVFGITATPAMADLYYLPAIIVDDVPVTNENKDDVLSDGGTVKFVPDNGENFLKLTLNNADISGFNIANHGYYGTGSSTCGIYFNVDQLKRNGGKTNTLVLELNGDNTTRGGSGNLETCGVAVVEAGSSKGSLIITGSGTLTAIGEGTVGSGFYSIGICHDGGTITIESGGVTAIGLLSYELASFGLYSKKIIIKGGTLTAIGGTLALLTNPDISELGDDIAIIVNTEPKAEGAARWDNATPLGGDTSPYKYVRFAKTCTVKFDSNGGAGDMAPVEALAYDEYVLPECGFTAPRGMKFAGWDRGKAGDKIIVEGDVVLKAQWEPVPISIYPPVYPAADPKPELNTADHYAYIIGYPGGEVKPNGDITRAETATIFFRMLTDESRDAMWSTKNSFTDVNEGDWFNNAVSTMENSGIIKGYPDGSFKPNGKITRAEFAAMAIRFFKVEKAGEAKYTDTAGHWAEADIGKAHARGLITGYPDGTFRPDQPITRAEAIAVINRMLGRAPHKEHMLSDMLVWTDNMDKNAWYYADVQEATNSHEYTLNADGSETWVRLMTAPDWSRYE